MSEVIQLAKWQSFSWGPGLLKLDPHIQVKFSKALLKVQKEKRGQFRRGGKN